MSRFVVEKRSPPIFHGPPCICMYTYTCIYMHTYFCRQGKVQNHDMRDEHTILSREVNDVFFSLFMFKDKNVSMKLIWIKFLLSLPFLPPFSFLLFASSLSSSSSSASSYFFVLLFTVYCRTTIYSSLLHLFTYPE